MSGGSTGNDLRLPFSDDDLVPISALQHLLFCPRQCALIHVERLWAENVLTVEGQHLHERPDKGRREERRGMRVARGLLLRSLRLGLFGKADVVEFHPSPAGNVPFPVEYKRGRPKAPEADRVQLCAQALCLEEMLQTAVPAGALFYGRTRRRLDVSFDPPLRQLTEETCRRLHEMIDSGTTPPPAFESKCRRCSLKELCLPEITEGKSAKRYLERAMKELAASSEGPKAG